MADVVLWSSLFAVLTEEKIVGQYLSSKRSILTWFNNIRDLETVKVSTTIYTNTEEINI